MTEMALSHKTFFYKFSSRQGQKRRSVFELLDVKQGLEHLPVNSDAPMEQSNRQVISDTEERISPAPGMPQIQNVSPLGYNTMTWEGKSPTY